MNNVHHDQPTSHTRSRVHSADFSGHSSPSFARWETAHAQGTLTPPADQDTYSAAGSRGGRSANPWAPRYAAPTPASCSAPPGHRPTARPTPPPLAADLAAPQSDETNSGVSANSTDSSSAPATAPRDPAWQQWAGVDDLDAGGDDEATSSSASSAYDAPEAWAGGADFGAATSSTASSADDTAGAGNDGPAWDHPTMSTASGAYDAPEAWAGGADFEAATSSTASGAGDAAGAGNDGPAWDDSTTSTASSAGQATETWADEAAFDTHTSSTSSSAGNFPEAWADEAGTDALTSSTDSSAGNSAWSAANASPPLEDAAEFATPSGASDAWSTASTFSTFSTSSTSSSSGWYADARDDDTADDGFATPPAVSRGPSAALSTAYRSLDRAFEQLDVGEAGGADEAVTASGASFAGYGAQTPGLDARPRCFLATGSSTSASSGADVSYAGAGRSDAPPGHGRAYAGYAG